MIMKANTFLASFLNRQVKKAELILKRWSGQGLMSLHVHLKVSKHGQDQSSCPHMFRRPCSRIVVKNYGIMIIEKAESEIQIIKHCFETVWAFSISGP